MNRLVVVSNRVAPIDEGKPAAGGLAIGVLGALREIGGIWFGWNGEIVGTPSPKPDLTKAGYLTYATIGMTRRDHTEYYSGFANSTLWPLFHYRLDLTKFNRRHYAGYLRVNSRFASALSPMLRHEDIIWIHDYHLIPLGQELRRLGVNQPMGFFLHTPFPALEILVALPRHEDLIKALCAYDLVGFQTVTDLAAFHDYIVLEAKGKVLPDGVVQAFGRTFKADVFPIGVDVEELETEAAKHDNSPETRRLKTILHGRAMIIGVDRLDYSKGLLERFQAFERMLEMHPEQEGKVTLMQVAPPSRSNVSGYSEIRAALEATSGHINGRFADFDWVPVRYLNRSFDRAMLTCFYRNSRAGFVTPLRDGMNLVAKEYIAAQNPKSPGVLVLSRFAGAAQEMQDALIVNPYDMDGVANALRTALDMPLDERRERWRSLLAGLRRHDIHVWRRNFLKALQPLPQEA